MTLPMASLCCSGTGVDKLINEKLPRAVGTSGKDLLPLNTALGSSGALQDGFDSLVRGTTLAGAYFSWSKMAEDVKDQWQT